MTDNHLDGIFIHATAIHMIGGLLLLFAPDSLDTAWTSHLISIGQKQAGAVMLATAVLSLLSLRVKSDWTKFALLIPQQLMMIFSEIGPIQCVLNGAYSDGTVKPWDFILIDQLRGMVAMTVHAWYMNRRFGGFNFMMRRSR